MMTPKGLFADALGAIRFDASKASLKLIARNGGIPPFRFVKLFYFRFARRDCEGFLIST